MEEFPVTVITGARQTGKSTLVRAVADLGDRRCLTLDDFDVRERAEEAPTALVRGTGDLTLDEVQHSPGLMHAVKRSVDDRPSDSRHLRAFLEEYPDLADAGVVLYTGEHTDWIVDDVLAVPWWQML